MFQRMGSSVVLVRRLPDGGISRRQVDAVVEATAAIFALDADVEAGDVVERTISGVGLRLYRVTRVAHYDKPERMAHIKAEIDAIVNDHLPGDETLRVLYVTASPAGDLRVDQEVRMVKSALRAATGRDLVELQHLPAATSGDLLDGLLRFRPQVIHFSGHSSESVLVLDTGSSKRSTGYRITAEDFAAALAAVDAPPSVVVLNSCKSEPQLKRLVGSASVAIGMSDSVGDEAAIAFAARLYAAIAERKVSQFKLRTKSQRLT